MSEPTPHQLAFLKGLRYEGPLPLTSWEASQLIDGRKAGVKADVLGAQLIKDRQKKTKQFIADKRQLKQMEISQAKDSFGAIVGFKLDESITCTVMGPYAGAFIPLRSAADVLPPCRACGVAVCDGSCDYEEVMADDRISKDDPVLVKPGKLTTIRRQRSLPVSVLGIIGGMIGGYVVHAGGGVRFRDAALAGMALAAVGLLSSAFRRRGRFVAMLCLGVALWAAWASR